MLTVVKLKPVMAHVHAQQLHVQRYARIIAQRRIPQFVAQTGIRMVTTADDDAGS